MDSFIKVNFKQKYERLLNGDAYELVFSFVDSWMFYDELSKAGIISISKEDRQKVWNDVRLNIDDWFSHSNQKPKPKKIDCVNESKSRLFKLWVKDKVDSLETFEEIIKK